MRVIHFGAGNIGRGFIGKVLAENGFNLTFVDVNKEIIEQINQNKSYKVEYLDEEQTIFEIKNVRALHIVEQEKEIIEQISKADLITTSVGIDNVIKLSQIIIPGLLNRTNPIDIICNENAINASDKLKDNIEKELTEEQRKIFSKNVGFLNSSIDRQAMGKKDNGEHVALVEPYYEWIVETKCMKNPQAKLPNGIKYVSDIIPYIERKLFIVNAGHVSASYIGHYVGLKTIQEVLANKLLCKFVEMVMYEHASYLKVKYQMNDLGEYINKTILRHGNQYVSDDIYRVGCSPLRKLATHERLVAPLIKLNEMNMNSIYSKLAVVMGLLYYDKADKDSLKIAEWFNTLEIKEAITNVTGIKDEKLVREISFLYNKCKNGVYLGGEMLTEEIKNNIILNGNASSWEQAIRLSAEPLLNQNYIDVSYVEAMINSVHKNGSYIVLIPGVAMPHCQAQGNVFKTAMSFVQLDNPVIFPDGQSVKVLFCLATTNADEHMNLISELALLLLDEKLVEKLFNVESKQELLNVLNKK